MVPDETVQRIILNQSGAIDDLRGELRQSAVKAQKKRLVKTFYDEIEKRYKMAPGKIDYSQFKDCWRQRHQNYRKKKAEQNSFLLVLWQTSIIGLQAMEAH